MGYEDIKFRFGKYKGRKIKDVTDDYLKFLLDKGILKGKMLIHSKTRLGIPMDDYEVTVEDSIGGDGKYVVKAYTENQAINKAKRQYKIQCTQSFHGTSIGARKIN